MATVAVIGCGRFGPHLARNLAALAVRVVVADRHPERSEQLGRTLGLDAVAMSDVWSADGIVIATAPASHASLVGRALEAGCDVLVEKPFTTSFRDAESLVARAEEHGRILMVDHTPLWEPGFSILAGQTGVERAETWRIGPAPHPGYGRSDALWDLAPHDLAVLDVLFGPARAIDASWTASGAILHLQHSTGVASRVEVGWSPHRTRRIRLTGESGCTVEPAPGIPDPEPLSGVTQGFVEAMQTRVRPRSGGALGARVVGTIESALERLQRAVRDV